MFSLTTSALALTVGPMMRHSTSVSMPTVSMATADAVATSTVGVVVPLMPPPPAGFVWADEPVAEVAAPVEEAPAVTESASPVGADPAETKEWPMLGGINLWHASAKATPKPVLIYLVLLG